MKMTKTEENGMEHTNTYYERERKKKKKKHFKPQQLL